MNTHLPRKALASHIRCPSINKWAPIKTIPSTDREIRRRRRFAPEFKTKIVAACLQGHVSIAQVARQHGLNTNLVETWIYKAKRYRAGFCRTSGAISGE